jgi:uncharacterized protein YciI
MPRFIFFYTMAGEPDTIRQTVPAHVAYWRDANPANYTGGPFADRTGGLITFDAASERAATEVVDRDPFVLHGLLADRWLKEWLA